VKDLAQIIGWIVAWGFCVAFLNFVLKFVNRNYVTKLPKEKRKAVDIYRLVMKYVIKYHKPIGIITALTVITHFTLMSLFVKVSVTGEAAMTIMLCTVLLGIYGAFINKNYKGKWLKVHRFFAFTLVILIGIHII